MQRPQLLRVVPLGCSCPSAVCSAQRAWHTAPCLLPQCKLPGCARCDGDVTKCTACEASYRLVKGKCVPCSGCRENDEQGQPLGCDAKTGICKECADGYFRNARQACVKVGAPGRDWPGQRLAMVTGCLEIGGRVWAKRCRRPSAAHQPPHYRCCL